MAVEECALKVDRRRQKRRQKRRLWRRLWRKPGDESLNNFSNTRHCVERWKKK